jgi:serine phosphatase RsbU (regulator of sigma subunit)
MNGMLNFDILQSHSTAVFFYTMNDAFYHHQTEKTLRNLQNENKRLREEIQQTREEVARIKELIEFHDRLEKDFFSANSLEELVITLSNCLQLRPGIDFVTLGLTRQYLESSLGSEEFIDQFCLPQGLYLLPIVDERDLREQVGGKNTLFEKTPLGSSELFFPGHHDEIRSHALLPLSLRNRLIGSLNLGSTRSTHFYSTAQGPDLLNRLCAKLAIAVDNILSHRRVTLQKELLDQEIRRAALLQEDLLPSTSFGAGSIRITAYFQPRHELGGDFYDFLPLDSEKTALLIADVSGHGFSAALIAAMLKFTFQTIAPGEPSPEAIVSRINQRFCRILKQDDFITLCCAVFDPENMSVALAGAGHPPPFLYRPSGQIILKLESSGPPVGVDRDAVYERKQLDWIPGDALFFYTDGVTEALLGKERTGGLDEVVLNLGPGLPAAEISQKLSSELEKIKDARGLEDDVTLLTVEL